MIKSQKLLIALVLAFAFISLVSTQDDASAQNDEDLSQFLHDSQIPHDSIDPEQQQAMIEGQRMKLWGCFYLVKSKLYKLSKELGALFQGKRGDAYYKRIITDVMGKCLNTLEQRDATQVFSALNSEDFNVDNFNKFVGFNVEDYNKEGVSLELEESEKFVYEYYHQLEEQFKNQQEEAQEKAEKEEKARKQQFDYEPHIGGLSLKDASPTVKMIYAILVFGSITGIFFFAYKKLFSNEETAYDKIKKQKQEKKKTK